MGKDFIINIGVNGSNCYWKTNQNQLSDYSELRKSILLYRVICLILLICFVLSLFIFPIVSFVILIIGFIFVLIRKRKLEYNFDDFSERFWNIKNDAFHELKDCKAIWYVTQVAYIDSKMNAGASIGKDVKKAKINRKLPWYVKTDVDSLVIKAGKQTIAFLPDKIYLFNGFKLDFFDYYDVHFEFGSQPFGGLENVPKETQIIDYKWLKVNKNGTPDQRYKSNRKIPIYLLGSMYLKSFSGLDIQFFTSRADVIWNIDQKLRSLQRNY